MSERIDLRFNGGLATLTLAQPPVNALDRHLVGELAEAVAQVRDSEEARALVVTGGPKVFAAGGDVKEMLSWGYRTAVRSSGGLGAACDALASLPVPVIAAINGYALGGGLEVALAADLRVCATDAKLGFPEILLGVIPGAGGTQRLPRLVGASPAKDLIYSGRTIGAERALQLGLVDHVAEPDAVLKTAAELAEPYLRGPALALRAAKRAVDRGLETSLEAGLELERELFSGLFATEDRAAGMASFVADGLGKAEFHGR
jgi:enoyl-CoA hydratase/carnithine racemase